jgi:hypothetical protein
VLVAGVLAATAPAARAQESLTCAPDDGFAVEPGQCKYYGYSIVNPNDVDATYFTRIIHDKLEVRDGNDQVVSASERDAFLDAYFAVTWDRFPFATVPDPADAARQPSGRTGGVDVLVEPVQRSYCGLPRSPTIESQCRLGRIHRAGSRSVVLQPTDSRLVYLNISFSEAAFGDPVRSSWFLSAWTIGITAQVPAQSDCPSPDVSGVCPVPLYER